MLTVGMRRGEKRMCRAGLACRCPVQVPVIRLRGASPSSLRGALTHTYNRLNDPPDGPQPTRDLARDGPDGTAHPPQSGMHDLHDRERLRVLCRLAQPVEGVPAAQVVGERGDAGPRLLARGGLTEDLPVR